MRALCSMSANLANCPDHVKAKWPIDQIVLPGKMLGMDRMSFRDQVLAALDESGMSVAELARRSGVSYDVINKLKRREGASTSAENAEAIAHVLGLAGSGLPSIQGVDGRDLVPVYNVAASAGHGALIDWEEAVVERLAFPPDYLRKVTSSNPANLAIIGVKGESMSPTLADNDVVMIDTTKIDLSFDGLFVMRDGGASLLVKRIGRGSKSGTVMLISDNKTYPPIERDVSDIQVVGKVVWKGVKE